MADTISTHSYYILASELRNDILDNIICVESIVIKSHAVDSTAVINFIKEDRYGKVLWENLVAALCIDSRSMIIHLLIYETGVANHKYRTYNIELDYPNAFDFCNHILRKNGIIK